MEEDSFTTGQRTVVKEDSLQDMEQLWWRFTAVQRTVVEEDSLQGREQF